MAWMSRAYLVFYDYGTGGVWSYLRADSAAQIHEKFRDLSVYEQPPEWMTEAERQEIESTASYDVGTAESGRPRFCLRATLARLHGESRREDGKRPPQAGLSRDRAANAPERSLNASGTGGLTVSSTSTSPRRPPARVWRC